MSPAGWLTVQNVFTQVFGAAIFAILAPLLGPRALGLVALVMVIIGLFESVFEIAMTDALLSVRDINETHYATANTASTLLAALLGLAAFVFAEPIAASLKEPELAAILRVMSVLPVFSALISTPSSATRRDMKFGPIAGRTMLSIAAGGIVGVTMALLHYGVWALVWQNFVQRLLSTTILWMMVPIRLRFGFSRPHFRELVRYGAPMVWAQSMSWGAAQVPRLILGYFLGAAELGLFSLAGRLNEIVLLLTLSPRYGVARVEMSKFGTDFAALRLALKRLLTQMGFLCFPVCIGGAVVMPTLFAVWLDPRWAAGVFPAQMIFLGSVAFATHYGLSAALLGLNRQTAIAINATSQTIVTVIVVALAAPYGLNAATAAFALRIALTAIVPAWYARKYSGISFADILGAQGPLFIAAALMGLAVLALRMLLAAYVAQWALLLILIVAGAAAYALLAARLQPDAMAQALPAFLRAKLMRPNTAN